MTPLNEVELSLAITGQTYNELCDQLGITNREARWMADVFDGYIKIEDSDND